MCILAVAVNQHPDFDFVCIHNRDECFSRPTSPAHWDAESGVICGRDRVAGGTWMGLHSGNGNFAALTNIRSRLHPTPDKPQSRGVLVQDFLEQGHELDLPQDDDVTILDLKAPYAGFNLLYANLFQPLSQGPISAWILSNGHPEPSQSTGLSSPEQKIPRGEGTGDGDREMEMEEEKGQEEDSCLTRVLRISSGVHSCSNSPFGDSSWPKVRWLRNALEKVMSEIPIVSESRGADLRSGLDASIRDQVIPKLQEILSKDTPFPKEELPDLSYGPFGESHELRNQSVFVHPEGFELGASDTEEQDSETAERFAAGQYDPEKLGYFPHNQGTRAQTIVLRSRDGRIHYFHRDTDPDSRITAASLPDLRQEIRQRMLRQEWSSFVIPLPPLSRPSSEETVEEEEEKDDVDVHHHDDGGVQKSSVSSFLMKANVSVLIACASLTLSAAVVFVYLRKR